MKTENTTTLKPGAKYVLWGFGILFAAFILLALFANLMPAKADKLSLDQLKESVNMEGSDWDNSQAAGQNFMVQACVSQKAYASAQRAFADAGGKEYNRSQAELDSVNCDLAVKMMPASFL